ncbi:pyroglutamyl-peptidase I [Alkalicoccobacillus gibsonii]|uniref:pyroglutamyl-peptidase I n=1 Tax=Alkalicoccobacillus gibsonii TaxID=79881 RepID=UPI003F7BBD4E
MKTLLLTGFEPFLDHPSNPTDHIARALDGEQIGNYIVKSKILPVAFDESAKVLLETEGELSPDAVMMLGLAAGRSSITPERIAINVQGGAVDNKGVKLEDEAIVPEGPTGYFSTLPIHAFVQALHEQDIPASISNTAGTYLCNKVMYSMLHSLKERGLDHPAGFVHIPYSHDMRLKTKSPSLSMREMETAVRIMIQQLT